VNEPDIPSLRSAECGREADAQARGWRALYGRELPEDAPEAFVFCPSSVIFLSPVPSGAIALRPSSSPKEPCL